MARTQVVARFDDPEMQERLVSKLLEAHRYMKSAMDLLIEVGKALRGEAPQEQAAPAPAKQDTAWFLPDSDSTKVCSCGVAMLWHTTPKGKKMPLDSTVSHVVDGVTLYRPHHMTCPDAGKYRSKKK